VSGFRDAEKRQTLFQSGVGQDGLVHGESRQLFHRGLLKDGQARGGQVGLRGGWPDQKSEAAGAQGRRCPAAGPLERFRSG
jgi:hypothetical protein